MNKTYLILFIIASFVKLLYAKDISTIPERLEYGIVYNNSSPIIKELKISNQGAVAITITSYSFLSNPDTMLSASLSLPLEISKNSSKVINVILTPTIDFTGKLESKLIFKMGGTEDTIVVPITADIKAPPQKSFLSVSIPEDSVEVNNIISIPIILQKIERNGNAINNFEITLTYNASILVPITTPKVEEMGFGRRTSVFSGIVKEGIKSGDTLKIIDFNTALGDATSSILKIDNIKWKNGNEEVPTETFKEHGRVTLTGIVYINNIPRLISRKSSRIVIYPINNPITTDINLKIKYQSDVKLEIYSISGDLISDISNRIPFSGSERELTLPVPKSDFRGPGIYIIKLYGKTEETCRLVVVN